MGHKVSKFFKGAGDAIYHIGKKAVSFVGHTIEKGGKIVLHAVEHPLDTVESLGKKLIHVVLHPGQIVQLLTKLPTMMTGGAFKKVYDLVVPEIEKAIPGFKSLASVIDTVYKFGNSTVAKVIGKSVNAFGEELLHVATNPLDAIQQAAGIAEQLGSQVIDVVEHPEKELKKIASKVVEAGKSVGKRMLHDLTHPEDAFNDLKKLRKDVQAVQKIGQMIEEGGSFADIAEVAGPVLADLAPLALA
jgi:hypothetical protein